VIAGSVIPPKTPFDLKKNPSDRLPHGCVTISKCPLNTGGIYSCFDKSIIGNVEVIIQIDKIISCYTGQWYTGNNDKKYSDQINIFFFTNQ